MPVSVLEAARRERSAVMVGIAVRTFGGYRVPAAEGVSGSACLGCGLRERESGMRPAHQITCRAQFFRGEAETVESCGS